MLTLLLSHPIEGDLLQDWLIPYIYIHVYINDFVFIYFFQDQLKITLIFSKNFVNKSPHEMIKFIKFSNA